MIFLFTILISAFSNAGGVAGNGGDIIFCEKSATNNFSGFYVLDYLATFDADAGDDPNPLKSIYKDLRKKKSQDKFEGAAESLEQFFENMKTQLFTKPNYNLPNIWFSHTFGLIDVRDENLIQLLPPNCYKKDSLGNKLDIYQTIVREDGTFGSVIFHYDPTNIRRVLDLTPIQFSYLVIHEWLRKTFTDANKIRNVNRLLHSSDFKSATSQTAAQMLQNVSGISGFRDAGEVYDPPISLPIDFTNLESLKTINIKSPLGVVQRIGMPLNYHSRVAIVPYGQKPNSMTQLQVITSSFFPIKTYEEGSSVWLLVPEDQNFSGHNYSGPYKYYLVANVISYEPTFQID